MGTADSVMSVETIQDLTVVRFRWPGNRASAELRIHSELDDFFERERRRRSKVIVLIAPPEVVDSANLELCDQAEQAVSERELLQRMHRRENAGRRLVTAIRESESFMVAVLNGVVALRMAAPLLACDYRIASEGSTFWYTALQRPVAPASGVLWFLTRLVGKAKTMEIVLSGRPMPAREALALGLIDLVTSDEGGEAEALAEAGRLAALPRETLHQLKRAMVDTCEDLDTYFEREAALLERVAVSQLRERAQA